MTHLSPIENLFAIEVPEDAEGFEMCDYLLEYSQDRDGSTETRYINLWPGSYEILFTTKDCSEELAAGIVVPLWEGCYPDYSKEDHYFSIAILSIQSLLRANRLDESKNYLLLKKIS